MQGVYLFGGTKSKYPLNDLYFYHTIKKSWDTIQYQNQPPAPRYGHSMNFDNDILYIFGGYSFNSEKYQYCHDLCRFDLSKLYNPIFLIEVF